MTSLTPDDLARIEELAENATPGFPYRVYGESPKAVVDYASANALVRAVPALVAGVRSRDERIAELETEVEARDAVIAKVKEFAGDVDEYDYGINEWPAPIVLFDALSAAPASVLAARDAEKWDEGFTACASGASLRNPYRGAEH